MNKLNDPKSPNNPSNTAPDSTAANPPPKHIERRSPIVDLLAQLQSLGLSIIKQGPYLSMLALTELVARFFMGAPFQRYSRITPNLHVSGQHRKKGWPILVNRGITAVINLRIEYDDATVGIVPSRYLHLKIIDNTPPTFEQLQTAVDFIRQEIDGEGKVYIHCAAGVGRAPTIAASYLVSTGLTPDQAWSKIRAVRPFIRPTVGQIAAIEGYAEHLKAKQNVQSSAAS